MESVGDVGVADRAEVVLDRLHLHVGTHRIDPEVGQDPPLEERRVDLRSADFSHGAAPVRRDVPVVDHRLEVGQPPLQPRPVEGRGKVVDHGRHTPPFRLQALPHIVDDVEIDVREIADQDLGSVVLIEPHLFPGQPFVRAVRADVDDRVGIPLVAEPEVERHVLVMGREGEVVIGVGRAVHRHSGAVGTGTVHGRGPQRLGREQRVSEPDGRQDQERLAVRVGPGHDPALLGLAPLLDHGAAETSGKLLEPVPVETDGYHHRLAGPNEAVQLAPRPRPRVPADRHHAFEDGVGLQRTPPHVVSGRVQGGEEAREASREDVQIRRAHILLARRIVVVDHRHAPLRGRRRAEPDQGRGPVGDPLDPLLDRPVLQHFETERGVGPGLLRGHHGGGHEPAQLRVGDLPPPLRDSDAGRILPPFDGRLVR